MLTQLIHHGVVVPPSPELLGLTLTVRGQAVELTRRLQEMALAWALKKDTPYPDDPVFVRNFLQDFAAALGVEGTLTLDEIDFRAFYAYVDAERERKAAMSREERRAAAAARRAAREALKARYGHAIVNGQRVELGTYLVEPSGIFMGRGQHPLRGRWKQGASESDITLNLSPDAPRPEGDWKEIIWQPDSMWVARWEDKLTGKLKYIWLGDTAPVKQQREARKFDRAMALETRLDAVRERIQEGLRHDDPQRRMIATACYLIDVLCLRVGDEKDPDEADTVGATTLRPEHLRIDDEGTVEFRFLGKDSVEWHKTLNPPQVVLDSLRDLMDNARPSRSSNGDDRGHPTRDLPQLFPDVTSRDVNSFLSAIVPGLSAKMFRTYHATRAVSDSLEESKTSPEDPEYVKWRAASLANTEAAILCNHTKQYQGNWQNALEKYKIREEKAVERRERYRTQVRECREKLSQLRQEAREKVAAAKTPASQQKTRERYRKRIERAKARVDAAMGRRERAEIALGKVKAQRLIASKKRTLNLNTSLKSYIDPRVYYEWGKQVDYDALGRYYPTALRRKFAWVRAMDEQNLEGLEEVEHITVRPCMTSDLAAVAELIGVVQQHHDEIELPLDREVLEAAYLPSLEQTWREALIAVDDGERVIAFAVVGPEWTRDEQAYLDLLCLIHPEHRSPALARLLAVEVENRVTAYQLNQPRSKQLVLCPSEETWYTSAPELVSELGLDAEQEEGEEA
ncbi:MAG: hypothetical protein JXA74_08065 [Anaerolineae bacterium]|nr:hypothetical protein [Anaerolineae bacterium]